MIYIVQVIGLDSDIHVEVAIGTFSFLQVFFLNNLNIIIDEYVS